MFFLLSILNCMSYLLLLFAKTVVFIYKYNGWERPVLGFTELRKCNDIKVWRLKWNINPWIYI